MVDGVELVRGREYRMWGSHSAPGGDVMLILHIEDGVARVVDREGSIWDIELSTILMVSEELPRTSWARL